MIRMKRRATGSTDESRRRILCAALSACFCSPLAIAAKTDASNRCFPRLMGMNIGAKIYDKPDYQRDLSRLDVAILGFYKGWQPPGYAATAGLAMRKAVQAIKALNPDILIGQYTVLNEVSGDSADSASRDLRDKLNDSDWWLLNAHGRRVQWTGDYSNWEVNFTDWTRADREGRRWPEWLAQRNYEVFFREVPAFDIVYLDNVMTRSRVRADWKRDGKDRDPGDADMLSAHRAGHLAHWQRIRELQPGALLLGNVDDDLSNPLWRAQLDGAFLEGLIGESWSIETWGGWPAMMARYRAVLANIRKPGLVGFNVSGAAGDYRLFRYAFASCLLDDGYFSFTDRARGHSSVPWFDEYDHRLGRALSKPPDRPWRDGVWRRDFEHGIALVNPTGSTHTITLEPGYRRIDGRQDAGVNNGSAVSQLRLPPKDGIVLRS